MHTTKAAILLGAMLSAGMLLAQAPNQTLALDAQQTPQTQPANHTFDPAKQATHLGKKLGLSGDQVAQIRPILADRQQQMQSLRADATLTEKDRRAKIQAIQQDSKSKMEAVMNDAQKQQFEQMLAERRSHRNRQPQA